MVKLKLSKMKEKGGGAEWSKLDWFVLILYFEMSGNILYIKEAVILIEVHITLANFVCQEGHLSRA